MFYCASVYSLPYLAGFSEDARAPAFLAKEDADERAARLGAYRTGWRMVGSMVVWDIAAILLIVATPLVLIVADRFGSMILAAVQRRRRQRWIRHHPPPRW